MIRFDPIRGLAVGLVRRYPLVMRIQLVSMWNSYQQQT